jgi:Leucine-rich repeat (LRR) protein
VDCGGVSLANLPENIDTATQVLNMTGSDIPTMSGNVFFDSGLTNLLRLYLRNCNIRQIHNQAFIGLLNLIELDLSENKLLQIPFPA